MGHEKNGSPQLRADLPFVDVVDKSISHQIAVEFLWVILIAGRCARTAVSGHSKNVRHTIIFQQKPRTFDKREKCGCRTSSVATRIGNKGGLSAAVPLGKFCTIPFWKAVGPSVSALIGNGFAPIWSANFWGPTDETVVCAQVDNHGNLLRCGIVHQRLHEGVRKA